MKKNSFILLSCVFLLTVFVTACSDSGSTQQGAAAQLSVTGGVMFGNPGGGDTTIPHVTDSSGIGCNGRGICNLTSVNSGKTTPVSFNLQTGAHLILSLGFHLSTLARNQPAQADSFFRADCSTYQFQSSYPLTDTIFKKLQLPKNPVITPKDSTVLKIIGDSVTIYIQFSHS